MLKNKEVFCAKLETNYNIDAVPVASTDALLVESSDWTNEGVRMIDRPAIRSSTGKLKQIFGGSLVGFNVSCEVKGSGTPGTPPEIGSLLQMCGMSETIVPGTSVTYRTASNGHKSGSVDLYHEGMRIKGTGVRGNVGFNLEVGNKIMANFTLVGHALQQGTATAGAASTITLPANFPAVDNAYTGMKIVIAQGTGRAQAERTITGYVGATKVATVDTPWGTVPDATSRFIIYNGPVDMAAPAPTYDAQAPEAILAGAFSVDSYAAIISALSFDLNWSVATPPDLSSGDGFGEVRLSERDPSGSFDPEMVTAATHNFLEKFRTSASMAITSGHLGMQAGNIVKFDFGEASYRDVAPAERDGIRTFNNGVGFTDSSGDNDVVIEFT